MKKLISIFLLLLLWINATTGSAQTVGVSNLKPTIVDSRYDFFEFSVARTPEVFWGGIMLNHVTSDKSFGRGNNISFFSYGDRDITFRTGTGNVIFFPSSGGRVGIGTGTTSPAAKLHVAGDMVLESPYLFTSNAGTEQNRYLQLLNSPASQSASGLKVGGVLVSDTYAYASPGKNDMIVKGSIGIGTPTIDTAYKLAVNGTIRAKEVKVEANWADFVFADSYRLPSLMEVEAFIIENRHLPEIPSEAVVKEQGINLGEMNAKLLQKIEELTLYAIDQQKALQEKESEIKALEERLTRIEQALQQNKK